MKAIIFVPLLALLLYPMYPILLQTIKQALIIFFSALIGFVVLYLILTFVV